MAYLSMNSENAVSACLAGLPREILLDIYHLLDLSSVCRLSLANKDLRRFYEQKKSSILLPVLIRDFHPFDEFLQVFTASQDDITAASGFYKPRRIIFKRFFGDAGLVLASGPSMLERAKTSAANGFMEVGNFQKSTQQGSMALRTVTLTERDLDTIMKKLRLVHQWEELFPQMRWIYEPQDCRLLRFHEAVRFRRAFYRWWLYGIYFHGQLPRPRVGLPETFVADVRLSHLRWYSTQELTEMMDLVEAMKDVVVNYIYPRLNPIMYQAFSSEAPSRSQRMTSGPFDSTPFGRIVKTYAKFGPEDLLHYFDNIYSYPKKRLVTDVHLRLPNFTFDQESIQVTISCILAERNMTLSGDHSDEGEVNLAEESVGGIIDFDDERDDARAQWDADGSPTGGLPMGMGYRRVWSTYSPRGDDGSSHEEHLYQTETESREWRTWNIPLEVAMQ